MQDKVEGLECSEAARTYCSRPLASQRILFQTTTKIRYRQLTPHQREPA